MRDGPSRTRARQRLPRRAALVAAALFGLLLLGSLPTPAQIPDIDNPFPRIQDARRWGPFYVYRTFSIDNIGYDNNVFLVSEFDDRPKESDFVVQMGPEIEAQLKIGSRQALTLRDKLTGEFWAKFSELNAFNNDFDAQYDLLLGRVLLTATGRWSTRFGRAQSEFDERTRLNRTNLGQRLIWYVTPKTDLAVSYEATRTRYSDTESRFLVDPDGDGTADVVSIETALNRDADEVRAELGWRPRNRTRFLIGYSVRERDFVADEAGRDAEETRVFLGAEFRPSAYISGRLEIGRSELESSQPDLGFEYEPYDGMFSDTELVYRPTGSTRIQIGYAQEARFSTYDQNLYYELTDQELRIETFPGTWLGFQAGASRRELDYPEPNTVSAPIGEERLDTIDQYYVGLLFRLPRGLQVGIRIGRRIRDSNVRFAQDEQNFLETSGSFRF